MPWHHFTQAPDSAFITFKQQRRRKKRDRQFLVRYFPSDATAPTATESSIFIYKKCKRFIISTKLPPFRYIFASNFIFAAVHCSRVCVGRVSRSNGDAFYCLLLASAGTAAQHINTIFFLISLIWLLRRARMCLYVATTVPTDRCRRHS